MQKVCFCFKIPISTLAISMKHHEKCLRV